MKDKEISAEIGDKELKQDPTYEPINKKEMRKVPIEFFFFQSNEKIYYEYYQAKGNKLQSVKKHSMKTTINKGGSMV